MPYKVFLVEDEIVTREGIRDSVDWASAGYTFCGEAPDGEIALPLIREQQPEVVITDIKMPFMDGLQLCRVLRETMPKTKIIILSGHDEFRYAQEAIQIGVTEYLLKPLSAQDLLAALRKVARQIDRERQASAQLETLQSRVSDHQALLREHYLLQLLAGGLAPGAIIEQSQELGIDLVAPCYLAMLVRAEDSGPERYSLLQRVDTAVAQTLEQAPLAIWCKKDFEETAIILRGDSPEQLRAASQQLAARLRQQIAARAAVAVSIGMGQPTERAGLIAQSFAQAVAHASASAPGREVAKPDTAELEQLLKSGVKAGIARGLAAYLRPLGAGPHAPAQIGYVLADALHTCANVLRELRARPEALLPELAQIDALAERTQTLDQAGQLIASALARALDYRDRQTHHQRALVDRARAYIDAHYADPEISLNSVAAHVTLSPSYFSVVFGREVGETFIEYLTGVRIRKAMELLRTTALTSSDIAYRVGYHNPRYFHAVFRKVAGQSPIEFRRQV